MEGGEIGNVPWGAITPQRNVAETHLINFLSRIICDGGGSEQSDANTGSVAFALC